jgi:NitT/TauT family transport system ATP-binding protein
LPLVSLNRISKSFDRGVTAIGDLSLDVGAGQFVSLLGPSGCGKSTVLRIIAGLTEPSTGSRTWPEGRPEMGFVFQEPTLMPWASAAKNVALPLELKRASVTERDARVREALGGVGLWPFAKALPRELSGGMKMRVSLARALVMRPPLLLLDEPFAALDELTREQLNDDLLTLWLAEKFAAVFVTHSVYESVYLSTRIVVMSPRPGRVLAVFDNPDPAPRPEGYRLSQSYLDLCAKVSLAIRAGMQEETR